MAKVKMALAELIEDGDLYPRHAVDTSHVSEIARAIEAGQAVPPPVIERKSKRIVDGWHRCRAYRKVLGRGGVIEVDARVYASEVDVLKDAVLLNSGQGRKLDQQDRTRSALMLERKGVPVEDIAVVLRTTEARVRELLVRVVLVRPKGGGEAERRPAKPVTYPAAGEQPREMTEEQYAVMASSNGHRTVQTVGQLAREIEAGVTDLAAPGVAAGLWRLHDVIEATVPRP